MISLHFTLLPKPKRKNYLKSSGVVPLESVDIKLYASIICYPRPYEEELENRLKELKNLGVTAIEFVGTGSLHGASVPVLGKGNVGIVVKAYKNDQAVALKIRRVDADRQDMHHEARMLKKANLAGVGPWLVAFSENFLLMELIEGQLFPQWLETQNSSFLVKKVLKKILDNCYDLDRAGLDHGELSKAPRHVIIDQRNEPRIIDFETSSDARRPANVTAICQFLFSGGGEVAQIVKKIIGEIDLKLVRSTLGAYKRAQTKENFSKILFATLNGNFI